MPGTWPCSGGESGFRRPILRSLRNSDEGFRGLARQPDPGGAPYDRIVRDLVDRATWSARAMPQGGSCACRTPVSFLAASEFKPELLAANTTRAFLGINLDCAQCHDHPFSRWTRRTVLADGRVLRPARARRRQAAGASGIDDSRNGNRGRPATAGRQADRVARRARSPTRAATCSPSGSRATDNPYLARNAVNRLWAYFLRHRPRRAAGRLER